MSEYFPTDVVSASALEKLHMCEQIIKKAVPLDAVPARRTKRCFPRFRPGGRFCELSFRYLLLGIEGEKCRPPKPYETDPFHPLKPIWSKGQFLYIHRSVLVISSMWYTGTCTFVNCACTRAKTLILKLRAINKVLSCSILYMVMHDAHK